jgi:predicted permease
MRRIRAFLMRLGGLFAGDRASSDSTAELESHLQFHIDDNLRAGLSPAEARRQALIHLGGLEQTRQAMRERRTLPRIENLAQDLKFGLRQLAKSPGFTLTAVLTLAFGIGALATVATWTNAVLYNPWPRVVSPRQLRFVDATVLGNNGYSVHYDTFHFLRSSGRSWQDAIAFGNTTANFADASQQAQAMTIGTVSSNFFQFLGLQPSDGRFFDPAANDRAFGSADQVVLSDAFWRARFNADPSVVGRTLSVNRHPFTVIGVAPPDFAGIFGGVAEAAWVPLSAVGDLSAEPARDPLQYYGLQVAVRLRPGVHDPTAAAELHSLARTWARQHPTNNLNGWNLNLSDAAHFSRGLFGMVGEELPVLFGASLLLMALVCINIASLLGQHAARRRREVAIRTSLGATPARIAAQVLTETAVLAFAGAAAGWAASTGMSRALYVLLPNYGAQLAFNLRPDARIVLLVAVVAVAVTLVCGIVPVRQALRVSQNEALHEGGSVLTPGARRTLGRRILVGLQLGISFVVLVCCGLLTRTVFNILDRSTGFNRANCLTASLALERAGYDQKRGLPFESTLLDRLRSMPGIASATFTTHLPMGDDGAGNTQDMSIPGYAPAKGEDMEVVTDYDGPDFFHVMSIPLVEGRDFATSDNAASSPVAVINQSMARHYWPKGSALGQSITVDGRTWRIVGVVHDFAYYDPANTDSTPVLFLPLAQHYESWVILALRPQSTTAAITGELRQTLARLDPSLPLEDVRTFEQVTDERYQLPRIPAELLSVYAISSVLVAMLGLYAVMAYSVIERYREFALRIALGSTRAAVFRLVLGGSAGTVVVGLVTGGLGSIAAVRLVRAMLFGVRPWDPLSYTAAAGCLLLTVFLSGLAPARRAASVDPMEALRSE